MHQRQLQLETKATLMAALLFLSGCGGLGGQDGEVGERDAEVEAQDAEVSGDDGKVHGKDGEVSDSDAAVGDAAAVYDADTGADAGADSSVGPAQAPGPVPGHFPPDNPFAADSPWPMSHRNAYTQASSPFAGPTGENADGVRFIPAGLSITLAISSPYADGAHAIWGADLLGGNIFKIRAAAAGSELSLVHTLSRGTGAMGITTAYSVVDSDGNYFNPNATGIDAFADDTPGDSASRIGQTGSMSFSEQEIEGTIAGMTLTYDGWLAFATSAGTVGVVSRDLSAYRLLQLQGQVSNSIATDENGGIYVVTSQNMVRVQWTGSELTLDEASGAWSADYETGGDPAAGRLGAGSGATPSLMGVGEQDRFVVITDGQDLMHLVLFWRDDIPEGWEPIAPGKDRRIAAEIPVTFGDPAATSSVSEQSVLIYDYGAVVVNNDYGPDAPAGFMAVFEGRVSYGVEKFEWDPDAKELQSVWANPDIACPNGIPSMSAATGLIYCIGKRGQTWTLEAIDWNTGDSNFFQNLGEQYNSTYAATEIGPNSAILTGVTGGVVAVASN